MDDWIVIVAVWWTLCTLPLIVLGVGSVIRWIRVVLTVGTTVIDRDGRP